MFDEGHQRKAIAKALTPDGQENLVSHNYITEKNKLGTRQNRGLLKKTSLGLSHVLHI
jgi:hypothetical protein